MNWNASKLLAYFSGTLKCGAHSKTALISKKINKVIVYNSCNNSCAIDT